MRVSSEGTYRFLMPSMAWPELAELVLEAAKACGCREASRTLMAKVHIQR